MSCERTGQEVAAYFDGELDLTHALEFERHLAECAECARALEAQRALRDAIGAAGLRFHPPPGEARRLRRALRRADAGPPSGRWEWQWLHAVAALLLVAVAAWSLGRFGPPRSGGPDLAAEVVASHVRSRLAGHAADVASSDRHTVKPWFSGRLDYTPAVVDLSGRGFPLAGGRLDYLGGRPVAALVYRAGPHAIDLFTWPAADARDSGPAPVAPTGLITTSRRGFHLLHWSQSGMAYWAVSDLPADRLRQFALLLQAEIRHAEQGP
jgi:anti-sigma factor RsiW